MEEKQEVLASLARKKDLVAEIVKTLKTYKRLYYKVLGITFVTVAFITICIPNYYKCTVMLAPELSGNKGTSSLSALASNLGVNLNAGSMGADALMPILYPDLMNSVAFRSSLFPIKVQREDDGSVMSYYDYLQNEQRLPWCSAVLRALSDAVKSLFPSEEESDKINPFKLTKEQYKVFKRMEKKVVCDVDLKTQVITIEVTDQDPLIAATLADSVQKRLQTFITEYRTRKARIDLEYNQKLLKEAEARYDKARWDYVAYSDANRRTLFEEKHSGRLKLENKMQIEARAYSQVAAQVQMAEAKIQEDTPAFTTLQPASVPVEKAGPRRALICLIILFLAFIGTTLYILFKEDEYLTSVINEK